MANNAIFARLANLWTGFISLWVSDVEKAHPEIAYQNAIGSMIEKYSQLKAATGAIIARRQEITSRLESSERELVAVTADLETALATNQDDLAVVLIQKKNALDSSIAELRSDAAQATADADSAKDSLMQVKSEIEKLKAEKDRMLAQMHSAQARLKIQGQLDGLSVDAEVQALGAVRDHIKSQVAQASLGT
jgi:phage shock protein A